MRSPLVVAIAFLPLVACNKREPAVVTPEPVTLADDVVTSPSTPNGWADSAAAAEAARARAVALETERRRNIIAEPVYFEFDRSDLSLASRRALDEKLEVLRTVRTLTIRVEGHADERGSEEYNMSLGLRRAGAVRRYLTQRDIPAERIEIVTHGEERPTCESAQESCWRRNRRAEFTITSS